MFHRGVKRLKQKHIDMGLLVEVQAVLRRNDRTLLDGGYNDHQLKGNLRGFRELHIQGDWLLVYRVEGEMSSSRAPERTTDCYRRMGAA